MGPLYDASATAHPQFLKQRAALRAQQGLVRTLSLPKGIDFSSNDYLGFANDPGLHQKIQKRIAEAPQGSLSSPSSRLLRGHQDAHAALEARIARWQNTEAALFLPAGYMANGAMIGALATANDEIISDAQNHASLIDAMRLSKARISVVPHNNTQAFADALKTAQARQNPQGQIFVVVESLYSMDGDHAPLADLAMLCHKACAHLLVDDAHAVGVFGETRRSGWVEAQSLGDAILARSGTFGKALAAAGAFVAGSTSVIQAIVEQARPFIFTTAASPLLIHAVHAALDHLEEDLQRGARLLELAQSTRKALRKADLNPMQSQAHIVPVAVGDNMQALNFGHAMQASGYDLRAIRPPTVAKGTARLRICIHADHTPQNLQDLIQALKQHQPSQAKTA